MAVLVYIFIFSLIGRFIFAGLEKTVKEAQKKPEQVHYTYIDEREIHYHFYGGEKQDGGTLGDTTRQLDDRGETDSWILGTRQHRSRI